MERIRHENLEEFFFASPVWDESGNIVPAPPAALEKYNELVESWMKPHPSLANEIPTVAVFPVYSSEREGYVVYKQIIYKPVAIPNLDLGTLQE